MLFLLRPRQTWMPYALPRNPDNQQQYNRLLQDAYSATRRVAPAAMTPATAAASSTVTELKDLARLHDSGALTDEEFAAAKTKLLGTETNPP